MSKRNSQIIVTSKTETDILKEYWKLHLLEQNNIQGIDKTLNNVNSEKNTVPTDLAVKNYVQEASDKILSNRKVLGEIENFFGVYSGYSEDGINKFIKASNLNNAGYVVSEENPLIVRIGKKQYKFTSIQLSSTIPDDPTLNKMTISLNTHYTKSGTEESKYLKKVPYTELDTYNLKNYYVMNIGSEYTTVRIDRNNREVYFEHPGGSNRSQWANTSGHISEIQMLPAEVSRFDLYDIYYVYINSEGVIFCHGFEPVIIREPSDLAELDVDSYGYNIYDEEWYHYRPSTQEVTKENIQLIGMVGLNIESTMPRVICSYSLPNYIQKNQRNTIRLEKISKTIRTKDDNNIITIGSNVLETKAYNYTWNFENISLRNTTVYLYITYEGTTQISTTIPYRNEYGGYYLHNKNWRCVGSVFINRTGNLSEPTDFNGNLNKIEYYYQPTFVKLPAGFVGTILLNNEPHDSENLNYGFTIESTAYDSTVEYKGIIK